MVFGWIREGWRRFVPDPSRAAPAGYTPLLRDWDDFYTRRMYRRIGDAWGRPTNSRPGAEFDVMERITKDYGRTMEITGHQKRCINLASYNYLGFAENPESANKEVHASIEQYGVSMCSAEMDMGTTRVVRELEHRIAKFVHKEDALVFGMGFSTNSTVLPALVDDRTLIISDNLNHNSLVQGCRGSKARIRVFKHNDMDRLEKLCRDAVVNGDPRRKRPWSKILIVVEGVYSMEGEVIDLASVVRIKRKYNCFLYVDEAHSIGAMGSTGRGIVEYWMDRLKIEREAALAAPPGSPGSPGSPQSFDADVSDLSFDDVDVLMGTFTKSFGSAGGYVSGSKEFIRKLRRISPGTVVANAMSPVVAQQVVSAIKILTGEDGTDIGKKKIQGLIDNARYLREELIKINLTVIGETSCPVVPFMVYHPSKMSAFSRECMKRGLAIVVVGYPATPLIEARVRICLSSALTREQLDRAVKIIDEVSDICTCKYSKYHKGTNEKIKH
jgi:serine palmitoyltransferase